MIEPDGSIKQSTLRSERSYKMSFKRKPPAGNRRWVRSNGDNIRGVITNKAGQLVQFESWLERALILRLDRDPEVLDYQSQPEMFKFVDEHGKQRSYTPDYKVWRRNGEIEIHEVTLTKRRMRGDVRRREQAAREICQERGWQYVVHTEQTLPQGSELANLLALAGYRPTIYANQSVAQIAFKQLASNRPVAFEVLVKQVEQALKAPDGQVTAALGHMLWHGELMTDLNQLLFDQGTIVPGGCIWLERKETHDGTPIR
jgi:hypothetical protein